MILKLNGYKVGEVITKPNVRMNFKDFTCTNTLDLQIGDIILVKDKTEPPIVVKDIANTCRLLLILHYRVTHIHH